jgi:translation initiation factor IF-2
VVKTRVHDLAAEFGVAPEQLLGMLKDMNIFVRSHLSALEHDQVSAVRVRWEREKRKSAEEPAAKKGRRKAVKAEPPPEPVEVKPSKRRRTAAEVAQVEAQAQADKAAELAAIELERPMIVEMDEPSPTQTLEERARALFKDLPPAPADGNGEAPTATIGAEPAHAPFIPPRIQRPPPSAPRGPKPVFSSSAPRDPRSRGTGAHLRPGRGEGRRAQEGEEGEAVAGGPGRRAGQHPQDASGDEGAGGTQGRPPLGRTVLP